ncbi:MAG: cytochrome P460 family protein [Bryobacteraceae bacterium]
MNRVLTAVGATSTIVCALMAAGDPAPYPKEYRRWVHVKTTVIGPQSPNFARNGGVHHFYANAPALEGYRTGKFPDGAVLIDDLLEAKEVDGVTSVGARKRVAVMTKQSSRFGDTGGWDFEIFKGDPAEATLKPEGKAACFACHQKARDSVFSEFRE